MSDFPEALDIQKHNWAMRKTLDREARAERLKVVADPSQASRVLQVTRTDSESGDRLALRYHGMEMISGAASPFELLTNPRFSYTFEWVPA